MRIPRAHFACVRASPAGLWLLLAAVVAVGASAPNPLDPPQGVFDDTWFEITAAGQKIGYTHHTLRRQGDLVFTDEHALMRLGRGEAVVEIALESHTEETVAGEPRAFRTRQRQAGQPMLIEGRGTGGEFNLTVESGATRQQLRVTLPPGTVMSWGAEREGLKRGFAPGTKYSLQMYAPDQNPLKPLPTEITVGPREKIRVRGADLETTRVDARLAAGDGAGAVTIVSWVDARGRARKLQIPLGGLTVDIAESTQEQALADFLPTDIFSTSLLTLDRSLPATANPVTFRLRRRDGQPLPAPPQSVAQRAQTLPDGSARLTLTRGADPAAAPRVPAPDATTAFAANPYLDTNDPELRRLALAQGGPAGAAPAVVAGKLRDFVAAYIAQKNLGVGFATASEVARSKAGDCSEHAVLLAALGRVRGIPTRLVGGLAYLPEYGGRRAVLGYHMWTQFYLAGHWVDYDAALPDDGGVRRLGLVASELQDTSLSDFTLALLSWVGDLEVKVEATPTP